MILQGDSSYFPMKSYSHLCHMYSCFLLYQNQLILFISINTWFLSMKELRRISELRGNIKGCWGCSKLINFNICYKNMGNSQISQVIDNGWYFKGKAIPFWGTFCNRVIENGSKVIISAAFWWIDSDLTESIVVSYL